MFVIANLCMLSSHYVANSWFLVCICIDSLYIVIKCFHIMNT